MIDRGPGDRFGVQVPPSVARGPPPLPFVAALPDPCQQSCVCGAGRAARRSGPPSDRGMRQRRPGVSGVNHGFVVGPLGSPPGRYYTHVTAVSFAWGRAASQLACKVPSRCWCAPTCGCTSWGAPRVTPVTHCPPTIAQGTRAAARQCCPPLSRSPLSRRRGRRTLTAAWAGMPPICTEASSRGDTPYTCSPPPCGRLETSTLKWVRGGGVAI